MGDRMALTPAIIPVAHCLMLPRAATAFWMATQPLIIRRAKFRAKANTGTASRWGIGFGTNWMGRWIRRRILRSESDAERNFAHQPLGRVAQCTTAEIYQSSSSRPRPRNCPKTEDEAEDGEQTIHIIKIFWATRPLISARAFDALL